MVPVWAVHAAALVWPVLDSCWQALKPLPEADLEQFVQLLYFYVFYFVFAALHPWCVLDIPLSPGERSSSSDQLTMDSFSFRQHLFWSSLRPGAQAAPDRPTEQRCYGFGFRDRPAGMGRLFLPAST